MGSHAREQNHARARGRRQARRNDTHGDRAPHPRPLGSPPSVFRRSDKKREQPAKQRGRRWACAPVGSSQSATVGNLFTSVVQTCSLYQEIRAVCYISLVSHRQFASPRLPLYCCAVPARAGWSNGPEKRRRQRAQGGWGRKTAAGRVGRRRQQHLRRGTLALCRPALELTLRALPGTTDSSPKRITKICSRSLSRRTLLASFCFIILRRHHNQKNKRCLQQQFFCRFSAPAPVPAAGLSAALSCGSYQSFGWLPPAFHYRRVCTVACLFGKMRGF